MGHFKKIFMGHFKKGLTKKVIFAFVLGIVISNIVGVFAYSFIANDVSYKPNNSKFDVDNVGSALNELYNKSDINLDRFETPIVNISQGDRLDDRTASLELDSGNYLIFVTSDFTGTSSGTNYQGVDNVMLTCGDCEVTKMDGRYAKTFPSNNTYNIYLATKSTVYYAEIKSKQTVGYTFQLTAGAAIASHAQTIIMTAVKLK